MVTILLFAQLQEDVGQNRLELELEQTTVTKLKETLQEKFNLTQLGQVMTAINEEYALNDDLVNPGDTVAFIPPVSGG
ncbi:molybdopterin synthase sulfur carrier subunit [Virgibacillus natechei]|uniref:Molybdopterin synthase sulfur carrier subunit n=1 Tax=Virgibacillus natechei TaxID=1216297 RepID=A0ABS4IG38_9BACI|nr:molybdopterin converting factor subunit 1 [Virgibacillus natechei]MBP1969897.1 molybdopterin synthase sulfur carrier subunit [Virgibacillus natechei]UZD13437.1 molybdopterin converting factor subunit 1 [Virgibacillus natechei]